MVHACNLSAWEYRQEDQKFNIIPSYAMALRPAWVYVRLHLKTKTTKTKLPSQHPFFFLQLFRERKAILAPGTAMSPELGELHHLPLSCDLHQSVLQTCPCSSWEQISSLKPHFALFSL